MFGDRALALAAARNEPDSLAPIYDRYADTIYDLCRAILRDPHEAADATQDTFVIAATRIGGLRDPDSLKPWLCAIARREAIRRSSKRAKMRPAAAEVLDVSIEDSSSDALVASDAYNLVWESADSLTERERAILVLNVRQGLEGAELAAAAGVPGPTASVILSRAKTQLASAVRCTLVIRNKRDECKELASIVPGKHSSLDALTRKRVARHAQNCSICSRTWASTPSALGVLAAAPALAAPAMLRQKVLKDPRLISLNTPIPGRTPFGSTPAALGTGRWKRNGFPPGDDTTRRRGVFGLAAAMVVFMSGGALFCTGDSEPPTLAAPRRNTTTVPSTTPTTLGEDPTTTTSIDEDESTTTSTKRTTTTRKGATTTTGKPGVAPTTQVTAPPPTTTTTLPPPSMRASAGTNQLSTCGRGAAGPQTTAVTGTTGGVPGAARVTFRVVFDGSATSTSVSGGPTRWSAALGPFSTDTNKSGTWTMTSFDAAGNRLASDGGSFNVTAC